MGLFNTVNKQQDGKYRRASTKGKRRSRYEHGTALEHELELFLKYFFDDIEDKVVFRTAASQTPADVWMVIPQRMRSLERSPREGSFIRLYQCKSTSQGLEPPEIDQTEFNDFVLYCFKIGARGYWVDKWKKNRSTYIRRLRFIDLDKCYNVPVFSDEISDWSEALRAAQKLEKERKGKGEKKEL